MIEIKNADEDDADDNKYHVKNDKYHVKNDKYNNFYDIIRTKYHVLSLALLNQRNLLLLISCI